MHTLVYWLVLFLFFPQSIEGLVPHTRTEKYVLFSIPHFSNPGRALHNIRDKVSIFIEVFIIIGTKPT